MEKHFVTFFSPGTFLNEESTKEIDSWNVEKAQAMAKSIVERHGARPFGFQFSTRTRTNEQLDSSVSAKSSTYYMGGKVITFDEVEAENDPNNKTLISNMKYNNIERVWQTTEGYKYTAYLKDNDIVL